MLTRNLLQTHSSKIPEAGQVAMSAAIGGTAEVLGGGKFANGAVTGAYVMMFNHLHNEFNEKKFSRFDRSRDDLEFLYLIDEKNGMHHIKGYISMKELNGEYIITTYLDSNIIEWNGWEVEAAMKVNGFSNPNAEEFSDIILNNAPSNGSITDPGRKIIGWGEVSIPVSNHFRIEVNIINYKYRFFEGQSMYKIIPPIIIYR